MNRIVVPVIVLTMVTACQNANEQAENKPAEEVTATAPDDEATKMYNESYAGKYALKDGCEEGKPVIELAASTIQWGDISCSIDNISLTEEGLPKVDANKCSADGKAQDDRSFTLEAGGMMSLEIRSGDELTVAKRCSAFEQS